MDNNDNQMLHGRSLFLFRVGPFRFCVPATDVEAIIDMPAFRSIPNAPPSVQGVFSHRGQIATVISLRRKLGLQDHRDASDGQLVLARISIGLAGFRADEVINIATATEKDVIELSALKQSTRFDRVLVIEDQIIQCTDFEQLYQTRDAHKSQEEPPSPGQIPDDGPDPVEPENAHGANKTANELGSGNQEVTGRNARESGGDMPREASGGKTPGTVPASGKKTKADFSQPASPSAIPKNVLPGSPSHRFRTLRAKQSATEGKPFEGVVFRKNIPEALHGNGATGEPVSRGSKRKFSSIPMGWLLSLAAAVMVLLYFFWPGTTEKQEARHALGRAPVSVAPTPGATAVSPGSSQQDDIRSFPAQSPLAVIDEEAAPADIIAPPPSPVPPSPLTDTDKDPETASKPLKAQSSMDAPAAPSSVPSSSGPMDEPGTESTAVSVSMPGEAPSRFTAIETEDFTLSIEPGLPETGEPSGNGGNEIAPPLSPGPMPEREFVHVVVKGDTLWDIASEYLGNPLDYPQLAEASRIRDPDWIYPGDRVRITMKSGSGQAP